jgi:hypothetical protein
MLQRLLVCDISCNDTLTGGSGNDVLDGGGGQNILHGGDGWNSPQIVDDSDLGGPNSDNTYTQSSGSGAIAPLAAGFNQQEHGLSGGASATWTFANLPTADFAYYDVYVTWSPATGAGIANYVVKDGLTTRATVAMDQSTPAVDDAASVRVRPALILQQEFLGEAFVPCQP